MTHNQPIEQLQPHDEQTFRPITDLMRDFAEHPSKEFHARHADAPWVQAIAPKQRRTFGWRGMLMPGIVVLLLALWFTVPTGFVAAFGEFFGLYRAPADTVEPPQGPFVTPPTIATLEEASTLMGFDILTPAQLPEEIQQTKIYVTGEQPDLYGQISYLDAGGYDYVSLTVKRGPLYMQIGATATVEVVQVGTVNGEYVKGGFIVNGNVSEWNPNYSNQTLRWQVGDISYMLMSSHLSKQKLIDLAASLQ